LPSHSFLHTFIELDHTTLFCGCVLGAAFVVVVVVVVVDLCVAEAVVCFVDADVCLVAAADDPDVDFVVVIFCALDVGRVLFIWVLYSFSSAASCTSSCPSIPRQRNAPWARALRLNNLRVEKTTIGCHSCCGGFFVS
jgi:hypothetical protein